MGLHAFRKTIGDVVGERPVPLVGPADPVVTAINVMRALNVHAVLVTDQRTLVGIFTERDLLERVAAKRRSVTGTFVSEVMTRLPVSLKQDACITYAINRMGLEGFSHVPMIGNDGEALGLVDVRDVVAHLDDVFEALEDEGDTPLDPDWVDIGGG